MPNWCEGNLRLRGTADAILEFIKNEVQIVGRSRGSLDINECGPEVVDEYGEASVKAPKQAEGWFMVSIYIKNTVRNFIDGREFNLYLGDEEDRANVRTVCIDGFRAAWGIVAEPYVEKARKYGIDIKIVGFECGMQFAQIIEIINGELVKDQEVKFDDWDWECVMPNMGG